MAKAKSDIATGVLQATPDAVARLSIKEFQRTVLLRWTRIAVATIGWVLFVGVWYIVAVMLEGDNGLPYPHKIATNVWSEVNTSEFRDALLASLARVLLGFFLAIIVSFLLSFLIAYREWWRNVFTHILSNISNIPLMCLVLLLLILLGGSSQTAILGAMLVSIPYITLSLVKGLTTVDHGLIIMSRAFGRTRMQIITSVLIPSSFYSVLRGARLAFIMAFNIVILIELILLESNNDNGIGVSIQGYVIEHQNVTDLLTWSVLFIIVLFIFEFVLFRLIENWAFIGITATTE